MKVSVHPGDKGGCGHYRMIWPAEVLIAQGHDIVINSEINAKFLDYGKGKVEVLNAEVPDGADVVVLQRPLHADVVRLIPHLRDKGAAIVVEIDDDFRHIDANNIAFKRSHPRWSPEHNFKILDQAIALADLVTVSTPRLKEIYGGGSNIIVLPNYVPDWYLDTTAEGPRYGVGWSGSVLTHPGDLEITRGGLRNTPERFRVVGSGKGVRTALGLDYDPETTEWLDISGDYQKALATLKVGVVPLKDSLFNHAKSWLKGLEYASVGVPFIASPTEEYESLSKLGAGKLASRARHWEKEVRWLLTDPHYWEERSQEGIEAAKKLTYTEHAWKWMDAWEQARINAALRIAS